MEALVNVVRTNPVVSLRPGNEPLRFVTACHLAQHKRQNQDVEFPADWGIGIDVPGSPQEPAYSIRWRLQFCYYYHEVEESMYFLEYGEETWRGEARLTTDRYWKVLISLHNPEGAKNLWNFVQDITNSSDFDSVHNDIISLKEAGLGVDWKLGREAARAMALLVAQ